MGLYLEGLINGRIFASGIWGAYFWEGTLLEGLIIGILQYLELLKKLFKMSISVFAGLKKQAVVFLHIIISE